jgi:hypothetical protein
MGSACIFGVQLTSQSAMAAVAAVAAVARERNWPNLIMDERVSGPGRRPLANRFDPRPARR